MASRNCTSSASSSAARACLCSPTSHPGSFRCRLHRSSGSPARRPNPKPQKKRMLEPSRTMVSKAGMVKALVMQLIKPSSHDVQRTRNFQPKPTRFCNLNDNNNGSSRNQVVVS
ncbi:hypothetical protein Pfo_011938 [Paulownia fortunei]|nr:hypothetical protein Pfo_011938 [Paulownia fortunei]